MYDVLPNLCEEICCLTICRHFCLSWSDTFRGKTKGKQIFLMGQSGEWVSRIRESQVPSFYEADLGKSFREKNRFVWFFQILSNILPNEKQGMPPFDFVNIRAKNKVSKTAKWPTLLPALEFLELAGPLLYPDVLALPHSPVLWWLVKIMFRHFVKIAVMVMHISVKTAFQTHDKKVFRHHVETGEKAED